MKKLYLIDGHALIFRSYYAFLRRPMINSKGEDTSILFGFTKTLTDLILREKPSHLAVAFDPPAKTFRHELYPEYKANRAATPELIKNALNPLIEIVESMSIPVVMKIGFEADDVIGTLAKKAAQDGFTVYMLTPDKDYGQLVSDDIFQCKPGKNGAENIIIGPKEIKAEYGIDDPEKIIDILAIWGDASDNVPGVRGVGEVGSKKLIQRFGSVENIYKNLNELPLKQQDAFREAESYISLSKHLVTIETSVDISCKEDELALGTPHFLELKTLFDKYEFPSLIRQIPLLENIFTTGKNMSEIQIVNEIKIPEKQKELYRVTSADDIIKEAYKKGGIGIALKGDNIAISVSGMATLITKEKQSIIKDIIENPGIDKFGYDIKSTCNKLASSSIKMAGKLWDSELMHYLLTPERSHKIEILAQSYLGVNLEGDLEMVQADLFSAPKNEDREEADEKGMAEAAVMIPLAEKLKEELEMGELTKLYEEIEMPLIYVLASMEQEGVKLDREMLKEYGSALTKELEEIENNVKELAGEPTLNVSSPKQLSVIIYDKLDLGLKGKKSRSTDEETLTEILDKHPIIPAILEFRNLKKLLSTYIEPLPSLISQQTGKLHTTYNQALTSTGRLSSVKPNLQNIPIRTERGREIRKAFIPSHQDGVILSADYSQIELRLMAHMSTDPDFIEAFRKGEDIHSATASKIFNVPIEELTKEQRGRAKTANFGIIYGISSFGLSQRLNIPRSESKQLIEDYFKSYPKVKEYMTQMTEQAKKDGYVTTLYGRKRFLPDISSRNPVVRGLAERNAVNAPIQGSAADIIKVAMVRLYHRIDQEGFKSKMVLQVHDELVFDVFPGEENRLSEVVKEEMERVIELSVPLTVECKYGENWLEAH
ncbi:MAG: DNA polymerase I [Bacteroidales bacterium]|nr:DNA polymerase I [Bacteroidales bacterium]